jgi:hypothetical protein
MRVAIDYAVAHGVVVVSIADKLSKAGWSYGYVSTVDSRGRTVFVVEAHGDDGRRFVVRADELLTAFLELERQIRTECAQVSPSPAPTPSSDGSVSPSKRTRNRRVLTTVLAVILAISLVSFVILFARESRDASARRAVNQSPPQQSPRAESTPPSTQASTLVKPSDLTPEEQELLANGQYIARFGPTEHSGHSVITLTEGERNRRLSWH